MAEALYLENSDLDCGTNNRNHHTGDIGCQNLVVRRGQAFEIKLQFSPRGYEEGVDQLSLIVQTGPQPSEESGTEAHFKVSDALEDGVWSAAVVSSEGDSLVLSIRSPPDARIGHYSLTLETSNGTEENSCSVGELYLIFNPWCPEDSVYLEHEEERMEYIQCQYGIVFQGTKDSIDPVPWNFGQFEDGILEICFTLLDSNPRYQKDPIKDCSRRNNPVYISRVVSAMVNCNDDGGVLYGRWDNIYNDGINPNSWIGSVDVMRRWKKYGCQPVRYGQCWVFAAVACSVLRCLGIPCRVITNYYSAHDTNSNLLIEQYLDYQGNKQKDQKDMIWNYHCWVEAWMTRPDLGEAYNGWQVVDPTPQEKSADIYCCGPAPVFAVKEGDLGLKFDVPFVFAEVNADVIYYVTQKDGTVRQTLNTAQVGQKISTKAVGKDTREDITHTYKYPEGSDDERRVYEKANQAVAVPKGEPSAVPSDVTIKLKVSEGMNMGNDFDVFAIINNNTDEEKECLFRFCARPVNYTGAVGPECGMMDLPDLKLEAHSEQAIPLQILYEKYGSSMKDGNLIKLMALLQDLSNNDTILAMRDIHVKNPDIKVRVMGEPKQQRKLVAEISLKNPLSEPLTDCCFTVEGAGLIDGLVQKELDGPVEPGQDAKVRMDLMPQLSGLRKLVVNFESDRLKGVKGFKNIIIAPPPK
ncbi:protein-glutamine gamma-glutamyltransferase 2 [Rana temporaria]|uniref:protein-glutamine gamma-glutamyltransferase 2 n=1 Tax=Rana temporaria TaxID=8407 RepID=UPI001AAD1E10|nr:protein-glutamine gamma-glutamyltransferase 2 [Rana temporaria]